MLDKTSDLLFTHELTPEQLTAFPTQTLHDLMDALGIQKKRLDTQIFDADVTFKTTGKYANSQWYRRAKIASREKGVQMQIINREISRRNNEEKREDALRYERMFIEVTRSRVSKEMYETIVRETMLRSGMTPTKSKDTNNG